MIIHTDGIASLDSSVCFIFPLIRDYKTVWSQNNHPNYDFNSPAPPLIK